MKKRLICLCKFIAENKFIALGLSLNEIKKIILTKEILS